jgi:hypothetical protein
MQTARDRDVLGGSYACGVHTHTHTHTTHKHTTHTTHTHTHTHTHTRCLCKSSYLFAQHFPSWDTQNTMSLAWNPQWVKCGGGGWRWILFGNAVSGHLKGKRDSYSIQIVPIHLKHKWKYVVLMYCIIRYFSFLNILKEYNSESDFVYI